MKNALWFVLGIAGGFVAAHLVNKDPRGHEVLAEVDARISEFTDRIGDAYRAQEAKIEGLVADAKTAASSAIDSARDAVSDAAHAVADAAEDGAARVSD
ncbi:MAG: ATPase [Candidatus Microbacterium phytovorans]|uniref:ATPase n=1 Tax=Candidatus Microbacterium phytovorans TaxID=3121374 RepID=A0AAJ5W2B6_9MICO|nr:ATPase [Microbacterium sp.]WEK14335.1 MAG: ATPase [Microbacterium sp.]